MLCCGQRNKMVCHGYLYKCKHCGTIGCEKDGCTNQNFKSQKCLKCSNYIKESV